jgi:hypothetical protein
MGMTLKRLQNFITVRRATVLLWAVFLVVYVSMRWVDMFAPVWMADSDDVMRLQQVHDLLGGQSWFDLTQHRLEPPDGGSMQWSRLADIGLIGVHFIASLFFGETGTDRATIILYPAILMLGWLLVLTGGSARMAGKTAGFAALFVAITMVGVRFQFEPGRIDHSLQILGFALAMMCCAVGTSRRDGLLAGIGMAVSLGTGLEALAFICVLQACLWGRWCFGTVHKDVLQGLGFGLVGATACVVALTLPPMLWHVPINDGFGRGHAALLAAAGLYWLIVARLPKTSWVISGGLGLLLVAGLALLFPELREMPYQHMDPLVKKYFLDSIQEAAPLSMYWRTDRAGVIVDMGMTLTGLGACAWLAWRQRDKRDAWLMLAVVQLAALVVAMWQARAFAYAGVIATLPIACWIAAFEGKFEKLPVVRVMIWLFPTVWGWALMAQLINIGVGIITPPPVAVAAKAPSLNGMQALRLCTLASNYPALAKLPQGTVMTLVHLGARIIAHTPHAAIAAPYHRNERGLRDTLNFFMGSAEQAKNIAHLRRVKYVVVCPQMVEQHNYSIEFPNGFAAQLSKNKIPPWLRPLKMPAQNPLQVYEVMPQLQTRL